MFFGDVTGDNKARRTAMSLPTRTEPQLFSITNIRCDESSANKRRLIDSTSYQ